MVFEAAFVPRGERREVGGEELEHGRATVPTEEEGEEYNLLLLVPIGIH